MGYLSQIAQGKASSFPDRDQSSRQWQQTFGSPKITNKEEGKSPLRGASSRGGSWALTASAQNSMKRLLEAMRSMAPGGWTDDRYEQSRHLTGSVYIAVHRICQQIYRSEYQVFTKDPRHPDGKRPVENDHPLVKILESPNPDDNWGDLAEKWSQQILLTGTALTWMVPNKLGTPMELYPIPTAVAVPQPAANPQYPDGYYRIQPLYPYGPFSSYPTPYSAVGAPIPAQWMLRFQFPHPLLRYEGYSPLTALRLEIDSFESINRSRWYMMKRGLNPSAVLNMEGMEGAEPLPEEEIERIRAEFENNWESPENVGKLFVASPGSRLEPWGAYPKDMEYQGGFDQTLSFIMAGLGITKAAAGMLEDSSYASLFATLKQFHLLTLEPLCAKFGANITRHLAPFYGDDLIVEVRCPRIDDHDVKLAKLTFLSQGKALKKNQALHEMEMPVTKEDWGNDMWGDPSPLEKEAMEKQEQQAKAMMQGPGSEQNPEQVSTMPAEGPAQAQQGANSQNPAQLPLSQEDLLNGQGEPPTEDEEIVSTRPSPGSLGRGALGPRMKNLNGKTQEKILSRMEKVLGEMNGTPRLDKVLGEIKGRKPHVSVKQAVTELFDSTFNRGTKSFYDTVRQVVRDE